MFFRRKSEEDYLNLKKRNLEYAEEININGSFQRIEVIKASIIMRNLSLGLIGSEEHYNAWELKKFNTLISKIGGNKSKPEVVKEGLWEFKQYARDILSDLNKSGQ